MSQLVYIFAVDTVCIGMASGIAHILHVDVVNSTPIRKAKAVILKRKDFNESSLILIFYCDISESHFVDQKAIAGSYRGILARIFLPDGNIREIEIFNRFAAAGFRWIAVSADIDRMSDIGLEKRVRDADMGCIARIMVAAEIARSVYGNRIIACARKVFIDRNIRRGKDVDAIGPSLKAVGFKVIDRNIGGISDINRIAAVIGMAVVVRDDPVDRDLVGMVDLNRSIRSELNDSPPQDFGIRGIIHSDAALNDRAAGDVKRLAAGHGEILLIKTRTNVDDIRVQRARRIGVDRIGKQVQRIVMIPIHFHRDIHWTGYAERHRIAVDGGSNVFGSGPDDSR